MAFLDWYQHENQVSLILPNNLHCSIADRTPHRPPSPSHSTQHHAIGPFRQHWGGLKQSTNALSTRQIEGKDTQVTHHDHHEELTGQEDQDCGRGDVARRSAPAASNAGPESHEYGQEGDDEQCDHRAAHVCNHIKIWKPSKEWFVEKTSKRCRCR